MVGVMQMIHYLVEGHICWFARLANEPTIQVDGTKRRRDASEAKQGQGGWYDAYDRADGWTAFHRRK